MDTVPTPHWINAIVAESPEVSGSPPVLELPVRPMSWKEQHELLAKLLQEGRVNHRNYLKKLAEHVRMPYLDERFFTQGRHPEAPLREKILSSPDVFGPWAIPLGQWDNTWTIGVTTPPPAGLPLIADAFYVLAPFESLQEFWQRLTPPIVQVLETSPAPHPPPVVQLLEEPLPAPEVGPQRVLEAPEGLSGPQPAASASPATPPTTSTEPGLEGLDLSSLLGDPEPQQNWDDKTPVADILNFKTEAPAPPRAAISRDEPVPSDTPAAIPEPPVDRVPEAPEALPEASPEPPPTPAEFAPPPIPQQDPIEERLRGLLPQLDAVMLLTAQAEGLVPFRWVGNWEPKPEGNPRPVPLATPSIFRIAWKTQKPFFGSVVNNDINSQFFEQWTQGRVPPLMSVIPLCVDGLPMAALVGYSSEQEAPQALLQDLEVAGRELTEYLLMMTTKSA